MSVDPPVASENLFESLYALFHKPKNLFAANSLFLIHPTKISQSLQNQRHNRQTLKLALTKPLLALLSVLLDNLNHTRPESLDGRNVVGEDTHVTSSGGNVDLNDTGRRVERLLIGGQKYVYMYADMANLKSSSF